MKERLFRREYSLETCGACVREPDVETELPRAAVVEKRMKEKQRKTG